MKATCTQTTKRNAKLHTREDVRLLQKTSHRLPIDTMAPRHGAVRARKATPPRIGIRTSGAARLPLGKKHLQLNLEFLRSYRRVRRPATKRKHLDSLLPGLDAVPTTYPARPLSLSPAALGAQREEVARCHGRRRGLHQQATKGDERYRCDVLLRRRVR